MRCGEKAELRDACVGLAVDRNYCSVSERDEGKKNGHDCRGRDMFSLRRGGRSYPTKIQHEQKKKEMMLLTEEDNFNRA